MAFERLAFPTRFPPTEKLFHADPLQRTATAVVLHVDREFVVLDRSIFYAESGGQEWDEGTMSGIKVVDVQDQSGRPLFVRGTRVPLPTVNVETVIVHRLERPAPFQLGDVVELGLDWGRRFQNMRQHSACHFMFHAIQQTYGCGEPIQVKGCHIHPLGARLDFYGELDGFLLPEAEALANNLIAANGIIRMEPEPASKEVFYWEYEGVAPIPCGGTHVTSASELAPLRLRRSKKGKGITRITLTMED